MAFIVGSGTILGTTSDDVVIGSSGNDIVNAGAGYDTINTGAGDDGIFSYDADYIDGAQGTDHAVIHRENTSQFFTIDVSTAAAIASAQVLADNTVLTNIERVSFYAGSGGSLIFGSSTLNGTYVGGAGIDEFHGGSVQDRFIIGSGDSVYAGGGGDYIEAKGSPALIDGGTGTDTLRIMGSAAFGLGSIQNVEIIQVANGALSFDPASGAGDRVSFDDLFAFGSVGTGITVSVSETPLQGQTPVPPGGTNGVNILGSVLDDTIIGGSGSDHLDGGRGNDVLRGGGGSDYLNGGTGVDQLFGEGGDDRLFSKNPDGVDVLLDGGVGFDFAQIERTALTTDFALDVSNPAVLAVASDGTQVIGIERFLIEGGSGDDEITTGSADDILIGNLGDDTLDGGAGIDTAGFHGTQASFIIDTSTPGIVIVTGAEGTDTLFNIEQLQFTDGLFVV